MSWLVVMWPLFVAGPLTLDEHCSYWVLDSDLPGTLLERSLSYSVLPPLSSWLQQAFLFALGKSEFAFRLPSALCTLLALFVVHATGKALKDETTGGLAALLVIWHPESMDETRIARCYGLVMLLSACLLWATAHWMRQPRSFPLALLWAVIGAALIWTHYTAALLVVCSGFFPLVACLRESRQSLAPLAGLGVAALILGVTGWPLLVPLQRLREWGPYLNFSPPIDSPLALFAPLWWAGLPAGWLASRFVRLGRNGQYPALPSAILLTVACSLLPIALMTLLSLGELSTLANPRYRVTYAPGCGLLIALLLSSHRDWRTSVIGLVVTLCVGWGLADKNPWQLGRLGMPADADWRELNRHLATHADEDDPILVQGGLMESFLVPVFPEDPLFLEYVACRVSRFYLQSSHPRLGLPYLYDPRTGIDGHYRQLFTDWLESGQTFWVACATDTDLNQNSLTGIQELATQSGYTAVEEKVWPNARLLRYAPMPPLQ